MILDNTVKWKKICIEYILVKIKKFNGIQICISTWQSIYKFPKEWFERFGTVFGDECHGFKSKSLTTIMNKCTEAEYRFGTTGTLDGALTHELVLQGLFGKIYRVTSTRALQDNDTLAKLSIRRIILEHDEKLEKNLESRNIKMKLNTLLNIKREIVL